MFEVNQAWSDVLGYERQKLQAVTWQEITHPEDLATDEDLVRQVLCGDIDSYRLQKRFVRSDGSLMWGDLSVSCVREAKGSVEFFISQIVDISESVGIVRNAAESAATHKLLLGSVSDMIMRGSPTGLSQWVSAQAGAAKSDIESNGLNGVTEPNADVCGCGASASGSVPGQSCRRGPLGCLASTHKTTFQSVRDALRESEERFELVVQTSTDVVVVCGPDRLVRWVSPSVQANLGWPESELVGTDLGDLVHPDQWLAVREYRATICTAESGSGLEEFVLQLRRRAGDFRWFSMRMSVLRGVDGELIGLVSGIRDVHDLVVARREAEEGKARLQAAMNSSLDPAVILEAVRDVDGVLVDFSYADANDSACALTGLDREQLVGTRLLDLLPSVSGSSLFDMYSRAVDTGEPIVLDGFTYHDDLNGEPRSYDIRCVRVADSLSLTWRDVTERQAAVDRLRASEEQFRLLAQNSTDVVVRRVGNAITWVSPSLIDMLGWHPTEWLGTSGSAFVHPDDRRRAEAAAVAATHGSDEVERVRMRAKGGAHHWVDFRVHPYRDSSGLIDGTVASLRIVDAEVASEQELQRRAQYDSLTGILSRKEALNRVAALLDDSFGGPGRTAILFCDIDSFKLINDSMGHATGDYVLGAVAERISSSVRDSDIIGRLGGDEVLVALRGIHNDAEARSVGEKLCRAVSRPLPLSSRTPLVVTLSVGATLVLDDDTTDSAIARADKAMYEVKQAGGNSVAVL
jgi:diguanylate cyclase (GGDEF)-like protein/PAS domain S-box-containing protein